MRSTSTCSCAVIVLLFYFIFIFIFFEVWRVIGSSPRLSQYRAGDRGHALILYPPPPHMGDLTYTCTTERTLRWGKYSGGLKRRRGFRSSVVGWLGGIMTWRTVSCLPFSMPPASESIINKQTASASGQLCTSQEGLICWVFCVSFYFCAGVVSHRRRYRVGGSPVVRAWGF